MNVAEPRLAIGLFKIIFSFIVTNFQRNLNLCKGKSLDKILCRVQRMLLKVSGNQSFCLSVLVLSLTVQCAFYVHWHLFLYTSVVLGNINRRYSPGICPGISLKILW